MEEYKYRSARIGKLTAALAKAQGAYRKLIPNTNGPRGMFANLEATLEAVREALSINELTFTQHDELLEDGLGAIILKTEITHSSGQWRSTWARLSQGATLKEDGNIAEIIKCRQAQRILGIAPSSDDPYAINDGGIDIGEKNLLRELKKPIENQKIVDHNDLIDGRQYNELMIELEGYPLIADQILKRHDIETFSDLPNSEYHHVISRIRNLKKTAEDSVRRK